jgi:hypothetical protein
MQRDERCRGEIPYPAKRLLMSTSTVNSLFCSSERWNTTHQGEVATRGFSVVFEVRLSHFIHHVAIL